MNIKLQTNEQLSATVANGLAGVFVNGVSLSASLSSAGSKVYFDNHISSIAGSNDLSIVKLSSDEYAQMLDGGTCLSNAIYIVEAPNIDAFRQQIKNVAPPTDLSDAVNKEYVDTAVGSCGSSGYVLETAQLVADNGSLTCAVNDQTITTIQVSSSTTPVVIQFPTQHEDGARDFILRIEISSSSAPTFTFSGVNETIDFDSEDDDWAIMEPGLNLVSFTETKRGNGSSSGNGGGSTIVYHTVTFDPSVSTLRNPSEATRQVEDGQPVGTLPEVTSSNFIAWFTEQNACGDVVLSSTIITADVTFYAYIAQTSG